MHYLHALRLALLTMAVLAVGNAEAQISVSVRVASVGVSGVDSDDVPDDGGDTGSVGDNDELRWRLFTEFVGFNSSYHADTLVLGRSGAIAGDPPSVSFAPAEIDVVTQSAGGSGSLLAASRRGALCDSPEELSVFVTLEGWEDDADLTADSEYDADEDDLYERIEEQINLSGVPKDTWTALGEPIVTQRGGYLVTLEVYVEDYHGPAFSFERLRPNDPGPTSDQRLCGGFDEFRITITDPDADQIESAYGRNLGYYLLTTINGVDAFSRYLSAGENRAGSFRHSGRTTPDTIVLKTQSVTNVGGFFDGRECLSLPSRDSVVIILDPPLELPESQVFARVPGRLCTNYDGAPPTVKLKSPLDPTQYDYLLADFRTYYQGGTRTASGFEFEVTPDYYTYIAILPTSGGCPHVVDNPDVEYYEPQYTLAWEDVTVTDGTPAAPFGSLTADVTASATYPFYDSVYQPYLHEYFDPAQSSWVVVEEEAAGPDFTVSVPAGTPYGLRVTDRSGCQLDTLGLTVEGPALTDPTVDSVVVEGTCALEPAGTGFVRVYATLTSSSQVTYLSGRSAAGVIYERSKTTSPGTSPTCPGAAT